MKKIILLVLVLMTLVACGGDGGSNDSTANQIKALEKRVRLLELEHPPKSSNPFDFTKTNEENIKDIFGYIREHNSCHSSGYGC